MWFVYVCVDDLDIGLNLWFFVKFKILIFVLVIKKDNYICIYCLIK